MNNYDLVVIGGGPAGYTGAIRAAKLGMHVALIEKRDLGGTCLNRGCIPTKALLKSAEVYESRTEWEALGILAQNVSVDQQKIYERKDKIVLSLKDGIKMLLKSNNVDLYEEKGEIIDKFTVKAGQNELKTKFILIASGSSPSGFDPKRPIKGIENALNSDDVLNSPVNSQKIVIIGGGVIAVEFASYFAALNKEVTMLVSGDRLLKMMNKDISTQLTMLLKRKKVKIVLNASIIEVKKDGVDYEANEIKTQAQGAVLAAVGRTSNIKDLGLENIGLDPTQRFIEVNENMQTKVESVYAAGDITGGIQLAHYAAASAITAVESMLNLPHTIDLSVCPSCVYTNPEIAVAGLDENQIENAKIGKFLMGANGKSQIDGVKSGFIKLIADQNDVIKGVQAFCMRATDLIGEPALAIQKGLNVHDLTSLIHPHPTVMEAVLESAEDIFGLSTHMIKK